MNDTRLNFRKPPLKGLFTEIAEEKNITRQAVKQAFDRQVNVEILNLIADKIKERKNAFRNAKRKLQRVS